MSTITTETEEKELEKLSPFEIKNQLLALGRTDTRKSAHSLLNAGRGNPNWLSVTPRDAFFLLGKFAMAETKRTPQSQPGIAGLPQGEGIADRLRAFMADNAGEDGCDLLAYTFDYLVSERGADADELALEWTEGILGCQYPIPVRILKYTETIVADYLALTMGNNAEGGGYKLFATEGSTAAMCYAFDSLQENCLLRSGDGIALMTPIFTPYLTIPELARFDFNIYHISAADTEKDGFHTWQYPDSEIEKLRNPNIKLLCLINPGNPTSYMISMHTMELIVDIVKNDNPGLMIITDDVYGTFVPDFYSLMYALPKNTLCLYSFSKYFGATGWRAGVVAAANNNIFDYMIQRLPSREKAELRRRYSSVSPYPDTLKFIDRMVADSRMVALHHTAGLCTPAQIQMSLFAAFVLRNFREGGNTYQQKIISAIHERLSALWGAGGITLTPDPLRAGYYSDIDLTVWARKFHGDDFAEYLKTECRSLDFVLRLVKETDVVVLDGNGFDGPAWTIRVSLANLDEADYEKIGKAIRGILEEYHTAYASKGKS